MEVDVEKRNYRMGRYVKRGFEDKLINVLKTGNVCIVGLAGMGKTTTARYVYVRLKREGKRVVYLTPEDSKIEFRDENGKEEEIRGISLREVWKEDRKEDEIEVLAHAVVIALNGTFTQRLSKGKKALEWLIQKFGGRRFEKFEDLHVKISVSEHEIREVARKLYEWFEAVFGKEVVKIFGKVRIRDKIEEFVKNVHENSLFNILLDLSTFLIGVPASYSILKSLKELLKKHPLSKIEGEVVFIVDDLADFDERDIPNLVGFLRVVNEKGAKILLVKRIDDTGLGFERYFNLLKFLSGESEGINLDELLFRGAGDLLEIDLRERIFLMDSAEKEELANLLEANGYSADVIEKKFGIKFDEALDIIYKARLEQFV